MGHKRPPAQDRDIINMLIDAWEALPGGRNYKAVEIQLWLQEHMTPAMDAARRHIGRTTPTR